MQIRLAGGRSDQEGRVEIKLNKGWGLICGDGWSLFEAAVVCRQLGLSYAQYALQHSFFGGHNLSVVLAGVKCNGHESNIGECSHEQYESITCPGPEGSVAGVICTTGKQRIQTLICSYLSVGVNRKLLIFRHNFHNRTARFDTRRKRG